MWLIVFLRHTTLSMSNFNHLLQYTYTCFDPQLKIIYNIFCKNHWVAFLLQLRIERVFELDSLDWPMSKYKDFLLILRMLVNFLSSICTSCKIFPKKYAFINYFSLISFSNRTYQHYIIKLEGAHPNENKQEMTLRTNYQCHKKPICSMYWGYYLCEHLRVQGRYTTYPNV